MSLTFPFLISVSFRCHFVFVFVAGFVVVFFVVFVGDFVVDFGYDTLVVVDFGG